MTELDWCEDSRIPTVSSVTSPVRTSFSYSSLSLEKHIGDGGAAEIYEATVDGPVGRIALKRPRFDGTVVEPVFDQFEHEAEMWTRVDDHDHVVKLIDWGTKPFPWLAMEYMDGGSLETRFDEQTTAPELDEALWIATVISSAVRYAHRHGVFHLDLKPGNVLFRATEEEVWDIPKVTDWGLSGSLGMDSGVQGFDPKYAAPEDLYPERFGEPDDYTDIYQLGVLCYELLTGERPFEPAEPVDDRTISRPSTVQPDISADLDELIRSMLAIQKADRPETVAHVRQRLEKELKRRLSGAERRHDENTSATRHRGLSASRRRGIIDMFDDRSGQGFVRLINGDRIFFHESDVSLGTPDAETPAEAGTPVEFRTVEGESGPQAVEITPLDASETVVGYGAIPGFATGSVTLVGDGRYGRADEGDVLVAKTLRNSLPGSVVDRIVAIVTDASWRVSRFIETDDVPVVIDTRTATDTLEEGQLVAVDGEFGAVFATEADSLTDDTSGVDEASEASGDDDGSTVDEAPDGDEDESSQETFEVESHEARSFGVVGAVGEEIGGGLVHSIGTVGDGALGEDPIRIDPELNVLVEPDDVDTLEIVAGEVVAFDPIDPPARLPQGDVTRVTGGDRR